MAEMPELSGTLSGLGERPPLQADFDPVLRSFVSF